MVFHFQLFLYSIMIKQLLHTPTTNSNSYSLCFIFQSFPSCSIPAVPAIGYAPQTALPHLQSHFVRLCGRERAADSLTVSLPIVLTWLVSLLNLNCHLNCIPFAWLGALGPA